MVLMGAIIEEIVDLLDIDELRNRLKNECTPLPILYALQNGELRANLAPLLNSTITETIHKINIVLNSNEVDELQKILHSNVQAQKNQLIGLQNGKIGEELLSLLIIPLKYIEA